MPRRAARRLRRRSPRPGHLRWGGWWELTVDYSTMRSAPQAPTSCGTEDGQGEKAEELSENPSDGEAEEGLQGSGVLRRWGAPVAGGAHPRAL
jgi:hypothetical protein